VPAVEHTATAASTQKLIAIHMITLAMSTGCTFALYVVCADSDATNSGDNNGNGDSNRSFIDKLCGGHSNWLYADERDAIASGEPIITPLRSVACPPFSLQAYSQIGAQEAEL
jgi:hypothetical protein